MDWRESELNIYQLGEIFDADSVTNTLTTHHVVIAETPLKALQLLTNELNSIYGFDRYMIDDFDVVRLLGYSNKLKNLVIS